MVLLVDLRQDVVTVFVQVLQALDLLFKLAYLQIVRTV